MTNALTKASNRDVGAPVDNPFGVQGSEGASGNISYVKFTGATGLFTYGQDDDVLEHGTKLAIDMMNAQYVWTFWWDGEVMEQFSENLVESPQSYDNTPDYLPEDPEGNINMSLEEIEKARKDDPANFRDGWSVQASFNGRPIDGSDGEFCFKLNQGVAMNAFHTLRKAFGRVYKAHEGELPIVEVSANSYTPKAKNAGKKRWAPSLKIQEWASEEALASMIGENPADYDDEQPGTAQVEDKSNDDAGAEDKPAATGRRGRRGARGANMG